MWALVVFVFAWPYLERQPRVRAKSTLWFHVSAHYFELLLQYGDLATRSVAGAIVIADTNDLPTIEEDMEDMEVCDASSISLRTPSETSLCLPEQTLGSDSSEDWGIPPIIVTPAQVDARQRCWSVLQDETLNTPEMRRKRGWSVLHDDPLSDDNGLPSPQRPFDASPFSAKAKPVGSRALTSSSAGKTPARSSTALHTAIANSRYSGSVANIPNTRSANPIVALPGISDLFEDDPADNFLFVDKS